MSEAIDIFDFSPPYPLCHHLPVPYITASLYPFSLWRSYAFAGG